MLGHSLYEKVANTISQANLSKISGSQTDWLEEEFQDYQQKSRET